MVGIKSVLLVGCIALASASADEFDWGYLPAPLIPADNPLTPAKVALGEQLFAEQKLSGNGTYSCATCHQPQMHFTDGLTQAIGATGERHANNTPSLYNSAYNVSFGWQDRGLTTLEVQHRVPLLNHSPVEMGFTEESLSAIADDANYAEQFGEAFGQEGISLDTIIKAIASYVRTLTPPVRPFDDYLFNDRANALSNQAKQGLALFFSPRLGCAQCHASLNFSGPIQHQLATDTQAVFHVTGVGDSQQAFRAPSLRLVSFTAPYMHDGSLADLAAVLTHYENSDAQRIPKFSLSKEERAALIAFLRTL